ncbi:hypothetical protein ACFPYN_05470 [Paenisporosarcina macmurdoensis]|uniref:Uncharacterized protein n=1 Tax=Paenisporosarcina macmurdoensis TaxID=212659 RepID=A0ABW1L6E0_9BACL
MKKIILSVLTFMLVLVFSGFDASAMEKSDKKASTVIDGTKMSKQELGKLRDSIKEYTIELTDQQVAEQYAEIKGVSINEAYQKMSEYSTNFDSKTLAVSALSTSCSWLETNTSVTIPNKSYKPNLIVYVEVCRGGAQYINTNKKPLLQEFKANPISYSGTISVELFNGHFYYIVNGNFYNSTSTSHSGTTGLSALFTATYSVGTTSNYYASLTTPRTKRAVLGY